MTLYKTSSRNINKIKNEILPNNTVICYYYTDNCPFCIMIKGLWKEICKKYKNDKKIILLSVKRDDMLHLDEYMHIDLVPSFIAYKKGKKVGEFKKNRDYDNMIAFINKYINK